MQTGSWISNRSTVDANWVPRHQKELQAEHFMLPQRTLVTPHQPRILPDNRHGKQLGYRFMPVHQSADCHQADCRGPVYAAPGVKPRQRFARHLKRTSNEQ